MNPSRVFTPEGHVSWGGSCIGMYSVESPGSGNEYERLIKNERSGYEREEGVFTLQEHNQLLKETSEGMQEIRRRQRETQARMDEVERKTLKMWSNEKEKGKLSGDLGEELLNDPDVTASKAPWNADVWKVESNEFQKEQIVAVLVALKLETPVRGEVEGSGVDKVLVKPNDVAEAGRPLISHCKGNEELNAILRWQTLDPLKALGISSVPVTSITFGGPSPTLASHFPPKK
ncbi:hypothetical protein EPUS_05929 [Endocarpon pusillum Z07020]|uniref:Uncharacterized protein n=1 Tax=Endocarpon pusillum (strain Z07020 / HMAS-L-300199) TaxID=1263415 RepID=U1HKB0_ENDPU|nr:uncharacterized protein EPUS_05929 [Endocarpon pusillum Z07020]ERF69384.1 hypothetical protein EPUS_05929 [Endocarpon pusillum Z07020]